VTRNGSKAKVESKEEVEGDPDQRPGAIGSLFGSGEEP
jgi:hypothetical protein